MTPSFGGLVLLLMLAFWGALFAYGRSFLTKRADLQKAARLLIGTAFLIGVLLTLVPRGDRAGPSGGFAGVLGSGLSFAAPMVVAALMERRKRQRSGFTVNGVVGNQTLEGQPLTLRGADSASPTRPRRWLSYIWVGLMLLAFAYWVWPTPYSYMDAHLGGRDPVKVRTNRFTGKMDVLLVGYGWNSEMLEQSPPAPLPVAGADTVKDPWKALDSIRK